MIRLLILLICLVSCHPASYAQGKRDKKNSPFKGGMPVVPGKNGKAEEKPEALFLEGEKYFLLEDYTRAAEWFSRAAALNSSAGIRYKLAEALLQSGNKDDQEKASKAIAEAISADDTNPEYYRLAAEIENTRLNFAEAARITETMISRIKGTESGLYDLAGYHMVAGNLNKSIDALERAEKLFGIQASSTYQKAELFEQMGKPELAEAEYRKLITQEPDDVRHAITLADLLTRNNQLAKAITLLEEYVRTGPEAGYARMVLAQLYLNSDRREEAQLTARQAMSDPELDPETRIALMKSMMAEAEQGQSTDAASAESLLQLFRLMESTDGKLPSVMLVGGDLHMALGNRRQAALYYRRALRNGATEYQAWNNLFVLDMEARQFDSLVIHTEEALESFPNLAAVWYFNGTGHLRRKRYAEATASFEQARKLNPENALKAEINGQLGEAYQALRNYDKADAAFEAGLLLSPDDVTLLNNFSYYLSLRKAKLERAEELASRLVRNNPGVPAYTDTYAWVLFARGKYQEARKVLEPVILSGNSSATHLEHYGDILFMLGNADEAVKHWEKALSMNSQNEGLRKKILNRKLN